MNFRLYRSRDRIVAGVAGGVADALDVDPSIVRIVWALAMLGGLPLLLYIVMAIVVPEEPEDWQPWAPGPAGSTPPGVVPATPDMPTTGDATGGTPTEAWTPSSEAAPGVAPPDVAAPAPGHDSWQSTRWAEREARRAQRRAERWERRGYRRDSGGAIVLGLILILLGAGFLVHQLVPGIDWDQIWPVGLIVIGGLLLVGSLTRRPQV